MGKHIVWVIVTLSLSFPACGPIPGPTLSDQQRALELIDTGTVYLRAGELDRAQAAFEVAYRLAPGAEALDGMGAVCFAKSQEACAEQFFKAAYQLEEEYSQAVAHLALLRERQGRRNEARALYEKALAADPTNFRAYNNYAVFLAGSGGGGQAEAALAQLYRAEVLAHHPIVVGNLERFPKEFSGRK